MRDGSHYTFVHRSFQEYFAAECAVMHLQDDVGLVLERFLLSETDDTFRMAYEISDRTVKSSFIKGFLPEIEEFFSAGPMYRGVLNLLEARFSLSKSRQDGTNMTGHTIVFENRGIERLLSAADLLEVKGVGFRSWVRRLEDRWISTFPSIPMQDGVDNLSIEAVFPRFVDQRCARPYELIISEELEPKRERILEFIDRLEKDVQVQSGIDMQALRSWVQDASFDLVKRSNSIGELLGRPPKP